MVQGGAEGCSTLSFFTDEYFKQVLEMEDVAGIVVNPGEKSLFLNKEIISELLRVHQEAKTKQHTPSKDAYFTRPVNVQDGFTKIMAEYIRNNLPEVDKVWLTAIRDGEEESLLFAIQTRSEDPQSIFDRMNTMLNLMNAPRPIDFMITEDSPWEGAELIYSKEPVDEKLN